MRRYSVRRKPLRGAEKMVVRIAVGNYSIDCPGRTFDASGVPEVVAVAAQETGQFIVRLEDDEKE